MRAREESAEAVVVKRPVERQAERRAEEPAEGDQPCRGKNLGAGSRSIGSGSGNYGSFPESQRATGEVDSSL